MKRLATSQRGQVFALTAVVITACLGMAAFVLDVGSWFREHRHTQRIADAAALAGAQELPDTGTAMTFALQYGDKNDGGVTSSDITFESKYLTNDTISVTAHRTASGFFSKILGIDTVNVSAHAKARSGLPAAARHVAPIAVDCNHPMLGCGGGQPREDDTTLDLIKLKGDGSVASGNFGLLDLIQGRGGAPGDSELVEWMTQGYNELMDLGTYDGAPGAKFNSSSFQDALASMYGEEVLLPVYQPPLGRSGSNAEFDIIGWVGFVPRDCGPGKSGGSSGTVCGHFTRFIAQGLQATGGGGGTDFGVRVVALVE